MAARGQHCQAVQRVCKRLLQCLRWPCTGNVQTARVRAADMWIADTRFSRTRGGCHFRRRVRLRHFGVGLCSVSLCCCRYFKGHPTIRLLWQVLHMFNLEQKKKFLFFCTGSDRAPIKGLGSMVFVISRNGPDSERLPTRCAPMLNMSSTFLLMPVGVGVLTHCCSHTCFNHFLLPEYSTLSRMRS